MVFCFTFLRKHIYVLFKFPMQNHYIFVCFKFCMEGYFSVLPLAFFFGGMENNMRRKWDEMHYYDYQGSINKFNYKWSKLFTCNMV